MDNGITLVLKLIDESWELPAIKWTPQGTIGNWPKPTVDLIQKVIVAFAHGSYEQRPEAMRLLELFQSTEGGRSVRRLLARFLYDL